jgi:hypothetical protein
MPTAGRENSGVADSLIERFRIMRPSVNTHLLMHVSNLFVCNSASNRSLVGKVGLDRVIGTPDPIERIYI